MFINVVINRNIFCYLGNNYLKSQEASNPSPEARLVRRCLASVRCSGRLLNVQLVNS